MKFFRLLFEESEPETRSGSSFRMKMGAGLKKSSNRKFNWAKRDREAKSSLRPAIIKGRLLKSRREKTNKNLRENEI